MCDYDRSLLNGSLGLTVRDDADGTLPNTQTYDDVAPGAFTVSEAAVAGYDTTVTCLDPDGGTTTSGRTATVDLDPGETVRCTFTNTEQIPPEIKLYLPLIRYNS